MSVRSVTLSTSVQRPITQSRFPSRSKLDQKKTLTTQPSATDEKGLLALPTGHISEKEKASDKLPTYEQAVADAPPIYDDTFQKDLNTLKKKLRKARHSQIASACLGIIPLVNLIPSLITRNRLKKANVLQKRVKTYLQNNPHSKETSSPNIQKILHKPNSIQTAKKLNTVAIVDGAVGWLITGGIAGTVCSAVGFNNTNKDYKDVHLLNKWVGSRNKTN